MSNYQDDTNEIAIASSTTWGGQKNTAESTANISDAVLYGLQALITEQAVTSDEVFDWMGTLVTEAAIISDEVASLSSITQMIDDTVKISELATHNIRGALLESSAAVSDAVIDAVGSLTIEIAEASDDVLGSRSSVALIQEFATAKDSSFQAASVLVTDNVIFADEIFAKARALSSVAESFSISDEAFESSSGATATTETAQASGEVIDFLHARQLHIDSAEVDDEVFQDGGAFGQAWTANLRTWATSRYSPYTFTSVAVIDGVAYATSSQGVFRLADGNEAIAASIQTGKIDIGQGALVHPLWAYLEYELDGTAQMDVTQTQSGTAETYTYNLPAESSKALTNGRFSFGRGLRGRHFSFALRLTGRKATINDLSVETAQTKRRV